MFNADDNKALKVVNRANRTVVNLFKNKKSRNLTCMLNIKAIKEPNPLTFNAKKVSYHL